MTAALLTSLAAGAYLDAGPELRAAARASATSETNETTPPDEC